MKYLGLALVGPCLWSFSGNLNGAQADTPPYLGPLITYTDYIFVELGCPPEAGQFVNTCLSCLFQILPNLRVLSHARMGSVCFSGGLNACNLTEDLKDNFMKGYNMKINILECVAQPTLENCSPIGSSLASVWFSLRDDSMQDPLSENSTYLNLTQV